MQMEHDDFSNNCENNTRFTMRDLKRNLQSNVDGPSVDFSWHPPKIISYGFGDQGVGCNVPPGSCNLGWSLLQKNNYAARSW